MSWQDSHNISYISWHDMSSKNTPMATQDPGLTQRTCDLIKHGRTSLVISQMRSCITLFVHQRCMQFNLNCLTKFAGFAKICCKAQDSN